MHLKENRNMLQTPDYTILDHLMAMCAVVDFDLRYLYVNKAAAKHEQMRQEEMIGRSVMELHSSSETDSLLPHLKECLSERKPVEFEDPLSKSKIKIEPVAEGAFIHWIRLSASKTRVKINGNPLPTHINPNGYSQHLLASKVLEIDGWLDSLDLRTRETSEHISRVANATVIMAELAGVPENDMIYIRYGALLHDIGKIGIPDGILQKPDALTPEEWDVIRRHPIYAHDLFYPVEHLRNYLPIPYSHHERWDGTGYPQGLAGEQIPLAARLFAVIDVWDMLSHDRVYAKAWSQEKVTAYIKQQSGIQFDPHVADLFFHARKDLASLSMQ
jgi:HD-GYP domain-containing protein (c-di-GMP phosphodiesterase class II)